MSMSPEIMPQIVTGPEASKRRPLPNIGRREVGPRVTTVGRELSLEEQRVQEAAVRELLKKAIEERGLAPEVSGREKVIFGKPSAPEKRIGIILTKEQILGNDFDQINWDHVSDEGLKQAQTTLDSEMKKIWRGFHGLSSQELNRRVLVLGSVISKRLVPEEVRRLNWGDGGMPEAK